MSRTSRRQGAARRGAAPRQPRPRATAPRGPERGLVRWARRGVQALLPVLCVAAVLVIVPTAHAEGPGYGGGADKLTVEWVPEGSGSGAQAAGRATGGLRAAVPGGQPAAVSDSVALLVAGVGFRGLSSVSVRVGSDAPFATRVDATGSLDVDVPVLQADDARTGTSVIASGRSPAGTSMTLVGAIPPRPTGRSPGDLVPWIGAAVLLGLAGSWLVSRLRPRAVIASPTDPSRPVGARAGAPRRPRRGRVGRHG